MKRMVDTEINMFENYAYATKEERNRAEIVKAALEVIQSAISASTHNKDVDYELRKAIEHLGPLADAIQAEIAKR